MRRKCRRESISINVLETAANSLFLQSEIGMKLTLSGTGLEVIPSVGISQLIGSL